MHGAFAAASGPPCGDRCARAYRRHRSAELGVAASSIWRLLNKAALLELGIIPDVALLAATVITLLLYRNATPSRSDTSTRMLVQLNAQLSLAKVLVEEYLRNVRVTFFGTDGSFRFDKALTLWMSGDIVSMKESAC